MWWSAKWTDARKQKPIKLIPLSSHRMSTDGWTGRTVIKFNRKKNLIRYYANNSKVPISTVLLQMWLIVQHVSQRLLLSQLGNALNIHYNPNANANASNITLFTFMLGAIHSISLTLRSKQIPIIYHCIWEFGVGICDDVGVCVSFFHHCNIRFSIENENPLKWWVILNGCQYICWMFGFRHF